MAHSVLWFYVKCSRHAGLFLIGVRFQLIQRPTEGAFFSSESGEKNRTGWSAKA